MPRNESSAGKWTDTEKMKIFFSMIDAGGKINWDKVYIPEGRTVKAVRCMLDVEKKKAGVRKVDVNPTTPTSNKTSTPQSSAVKGSKTSTPQSSAVKGGKNKAKITGKGKGIKRTIAAEEEDGQSEEENKQNKKRKVDTESDTESLTDVEDPSTPSPPLGSTPPGMTKKEEIFEA